MDSIRTPRLRSPRRLAVAAAALLLLALAGPARGDLDVSSPPGTPDEWGRGLPTPVTTGRGRVPEVTRQPDNGDGVGPHGHERTIVAEPAPRRLDIPQLNTFNYFRVSTPDMPGHVVLQFPEHTIGPEGGGRVVTGPSGKLGEYPALFPPELVWDAMCTCLRMQMHPEVVSDAAAIGHLLAIGEPAVAGVQLCGSKELIERINQLIGDVPSGKPNVPVQRGRGNYEKMLIHLAAIELIENWPGVMDPGYCRRILSLGDDAVKALIVCSEVNHAPMARAATWALGGFAHDDALEQLRKLATSRDAVIRVRALRALARARDTEASKVFQSAISDNDPIFQVLGWQGIGAIGDTRIMGQLRRALSDAVQNTDRDLLMAMLPALVRMRPDADDKPLIRLLLKASEQFLAAFPKPEAPPSYGVMRFGGSAIAPEQVGFRNEIFHQMTLMALCACGHAPAITEFLQRKFETFHQVNWFLWCDTCHLLRDDERAVRALEALVRDAVDPMIAVYALQLLGRGGARQPFLEEIARGNEFDYMSRGQALLVLGHMNPALGRTVCHDVLLGMDLDQPKHTPRNRQAADAQRYAEIMLWLRTPALNRDPAKVRDMQRELAQLRVRMAGNQQPPAALSRSARAWFVTTMLSVGGRIGAWEYDDIAPVVRMGLVSAMTARREGSSNLREIPSITTFPPLFETAVLELGRTADARAVPLLLEVLRSNVAGGSPEAAIGLGNFKYRSVVSALIDSLIAEDPWQRFCAWRSLKTLSTEDWMVDWFDTNRSSMSASAKKYRAWMDRTFR